MFELVLHVPKTATVKDRATVVKTIATVKALATLAQKIATVKALATLAKTIATAKERATVAKTIATVKDLAPFVQTIATAKGKKTKNMKTVQNLTNQAGMRGKKQVPHSDMAIFNVIFIIILSNYQYY